MVFAKLGYAPCVVVKPFHARERVAPWHVESERKKGNGDE